MIKRMFELRLNLAICYTWYHDKGYNYRKFLYCLMKTAKYKIVWINIISNHKSIYIFINPQMAVLILIVMVVYSIQNNTNHVHQDNVLFLHLKYQLEQIMYIKNVS